MQTTIIIKSETKENLLKSLQLIRHQLKLVFNSGLETKVIEIIDNTDCNSHQVFIVSDNKHNSVDN